MYSQYSCSHCHLSVHWSELPQHEEICSENVKNRCSRCYKISEFLNPIDAGVQLCHECNSGFKNENEDVGKNAGKYWDIYRSDSKKGHHKLVAKIMKNAEQNRIIDGYRNRTTPQGSGRNNNNGNIPQGTASMCHDDSPDHSNTNISHSIMGNTNIGYNIPTNTNYNIPTNTNYNIPGNIETPCDTSSVYSNIDESSTNIYDLPKFYIERKNNRFNYMPQQAPFDSFKEYRKDGMKATPSPVAIPRNVEIDTRCIHCLKSIIFDKLEDHEFNCARNPANECKYCAKGFSSYCGMPANKIKEEHETLCASSPFSNTSCRYCNRVFNASKNRSALYKAMEHEHVCEKNHHNYCKYCNYTFKGDADRLAHSDICRSSPNNNARCRHCKKVIYGDETSVLEENMINHRNVCRHHPKNRCPFCGINYIYDHRVMTKANRVRHESECRVEGDLCSGSYSEYDGNISYVDADPLITEKKLIIDKIKHLHGPALRKQLRQYQLQWHPDKAPNSPFAEEMFNYVSGLWSQYMKKT